MNDKANLRKHARLSKSKLDFDDISLKIQQTLIASEFFKDAKTVMLYMALDDEVKTDLLFKHLLDNGVRCCFPVVCENDIIIKMYSEKGFSKGAFGINEPVGEIVSPSAVDVCVVPGVMFDLNHRRLGRGKGYYDRLLRQMAATTIGICPDLLLIDSLPSEEHDIPVDAVVTELRII